MAKLPVTIIPATPHKPTMSLAGLTRLIYTFHAIGMLVAGITNVVAIIIHYLKVKDITDPFIKSHFRWQIRTFWIGCAWLLLGLVTSVFLVGIPIVIGAWVWMIYRYIKGWLSFEDGKPMPM